MPLINRCGGGGGTPQLCGQVENFKVSAGSQYTGTLTWDAPNPDEDNSFVGARIVRKTGSAPTGINDGTVVYEGTALTYTDTGLTAGTTYYYRAFAYNARKKYQTAMRVGSLKASSYADIFANNSWDDIITACQNGSIPSAWMAGDSKEMIIDGAAYQVDIIGKDYDTYTAGGTAPLTFQLHDCLSDKLQISNSPDWRYSYGARHIIDKDTYRNLLPSNVKAAIKTVTKIEQDTPYNANLFLPSLREVDGFYTVSQGTQYAYYAAGNSKVKKIRDGLETDWWLSDMDYINQTYVNYYITSDGIVTSGSTTASASKGVAFAFCF